MKTQIKDTMGKIGIPPEAIALEQPANVDVSEIVMCPTTQS
jgi:hypothetical protein